ncbi:alpha/beta hydrolase [Pannonibacter sp.]|uniref:alpha/beta hydrolase n=1 Tax=Pannonibacter sp. TaxID=1906786 RepID=UPI003F71B3A2
MRKRHDIPAGTLHSLTVESDLIAANLLGDPAARETVVYVPHGHDGHDLPLLMDLAGFTGSGPGHVAWKNFGENLPERLDRLILDGVLPPAVVAMPDAFTRLGGNQYIDSAAMGLWGQYLTGPVLAAVEARFGCGGKGRRGVFGKSSGGYGALVHALLYPDVWSAAACHSGDMAFELCYLPDMPNVLRALARKDMSIEKFITDFEAGPKFSGGDIHVLMSLAMAASYDPDPDAFLGIRLPVDSATCELIEDRWSAWLAHDPLNLAPSRLDALRSLKALWIDCGRIDQYNLVYGARRLTRLLTAGNVTHTYEEFDDNHSSIDYRLDHSLPALVKALNG